MNNITLNLVRQDIRPALEWYLKKLLEIHKDNIVSISLYGSATGKHFLPKKSDINLVVIFRELGFKQLKTSLRLINRGIAKKIPAPLFLSLSHVETSKDTFPIEFLEIEENNILLYGEDIFSNLRINQAYIRLFCEHEIKGKLIRLREAFLEIGLKRKGVESLIKESLNMLMPAFRALIRIKAREKPPVEKTLVVTELSNLYNLDNNVFMHILGHKTAIAAVNTEIIFEKYLSELTKLSKIVDQL